MKKIVVSAPSWFSQSGGITVLHKFVHTLNELGYDGYLAPSAPSGLGWHPNHIQFNISDRYDKIKLITEEVYKNLDDAIVVYPESWYGNYLNAPNVVRWILGPLNKSYTESGNMYGFSYDGWNENDLWFWYNDMYKTKTFNSFNKCMDNNLNLTEFYRDIFFDKNQERTVNYWTLRKSNGKINPNDYIHDSSDLFLGDIDKSLSNPDFDIAGNYKKLAEVLNKTKRFYSYDTYTFVSIQAVMCGADSIVVPTSGLDKKDFYSGSEFNKYISYGLNDIKKAQSIRNELDNHITEFEKRSIQQIHTFIEKCNDYFR